MYKKMFYFSLLIACGCIVYVAMDYRNMSIWTLLLIALPGGTGAAYAMDNAEKRCLKLRDIYFALLDRLERDPDNTKLRIEVLEAGRAFYSEGSPDYVNVQGGNVWLDDHSAGREARIQSDINARIGGARKSA